MNNVFSDGGKKKKKLHLSLVGSFIEVGQSVHHRWHMKMDDMRSSQRGKKSISTAPWWLAEAKVQSPSYLSGRTWAKSTSQINTS